MATDLTKLKKVKPIQLYEWTRDVSGVFNHWQVQVLNGNACLHIEGDEESGYVGHIQLNHAYNPDLNNIFESKPTVTLDKCCRDLEKEWHKLVSGESLKKLKESKE